MLPAAPVPQKVVRLRAAGTSKRSKLFPSSQTYTLPPAPPGAAAMPFTEFMSADVPTPLAEPAAPLALPTQALTTRVAVSNTLTALFKLSEISARLLLVLIHTKRGPLRVFEPSAPCAMPAPPAPPATVVVAPEAKLTRRMACDDWSATYSQPRASSSATPEGPPNITALPLPESQAPPPGALHSEPFPASVLTAPLGSAMARM